MKRHTLLLLIVCLASMPLLGGCQALAGLWTVFVKYETIDAKFPLPENKRILVLPDDMFNPLSYPPAKRALARKINDMLAEKNVAADLVPYDELVDLIAAEPDFNKLSVSTVGRKLGADLVIYVLLDSLQLKDSPADSLWHGRFGARVRVIEVGQGRIWPEEPTGHEIAIVEPSTENLSETYGEKLALVLAYKLGEKVGYLFTDHKEEIMRMRTPKFDALE